MVETDVVLLGNEKPEPLGDSGLVSRILVELEFRSDKPSSHAVVASQKQERLEGVDLHVAIVSNGRALRQRSTCRRWSYLLSQETKGDLRVRRIPAQANFDNG